MDTGDRGKKTSKKPKLVKDESGPSSKRWMRSHAKKSSVKVGATTGMKSVGGEKKAKIGKDGKSAKKGTQKRKLSTADHETSPKRSLRSGKKQSGETVQGEVSNEKSDGDEKKTKVGSGKGKKRKLPSEEVGSHKPSKRRLNDKNKDNPEETVATESGEMPNINLPGELLVKIIEMVPLSQWASLESVSRQFQGVVHGLWGQQREIRLNELAYRPCYELDQHQVVNGALRKFLIRAPNVALINGFARFFDEWEPILPPTIRLLSKFKHLETIDFSGKLVITSDDFAAFLKSSASRQSWKHLDIDGGIFGGLDNKNVVKRKNQPALKLEYFKFVSLCNFGRFLRIEWSGLKKLVIDHSMPGKELLPIIRQCKQVDHLEFEVPKCGNNGQPSYGEFLQSVADLENLSALKIVGNGSSQFRDAFLLVLNGDLALRRITELVLDECNDQIVDAIIDRLPHLKSLDLNVESCTQASRQRLTNEMGQLESLKLQASPGIGRQIDGTFVRAIGEKMSNLQCLRLQNLADIDSNDFASLGNLRNLKEMRIKGKGLKSETIKAWNRQGFGSSLETLEFGLDDISPEVMGSFFKNTPRLRWLKLRGASHGSLKAIAKFCPNLVTLKLWKWPTITCAEIQSVIDRCALLKVLQVRYHYHASFQASLEVGKYRKIFDFNDELSSDDD